MLLFRAMLGMLLLFLASCSFTPVYTKSNLEEIDGKVAIFVSGGTPFAARSLKNLLQSELNLKSSSQISKYNLEVTLSKNNEEFVVTRYSYSTRSRVKIVANYKLTETATGQVLDRGSVSDSSSFDLDQTSEYSNYVAEQYSENNSLKMVKSEIISRVFAVILKTKNDKKQDAAEKKY